MGAILREYFPALLLTCLVEMQVWCRDRTASDAGSTSTLPLAGPLGLASLWAGVRLSRRRPK